MAKLSTPIFLVSLLTLLTLLPTNYGFSRSISKEELGIKDDNNNQTHLTFYFHDIVSGPNPSVIQIARANSTTNQSPFGTLAMMDDPLTEGPENTSKLVGRAQGMYGVADQQGPGLLMIMNFYFMEGDFNGSTLSVLGRNHISDGVREMPVVGGTRAFRFAKGYAQARTRTFDPNTGDAVVQYNVFVNHDSSNGGSQSGVGSTGSTTSNGAPSSSQASFSRMVSFSSFITMIPLLYLCLF